jgi:hypothetical protein
MNPKPIFKLFNPKGKVQVLVHQGATTLIISSVALSLVALTACMQVVPAREPVAEVAPPQVEASEQHGMEALPNIDPADRKFFSPGYGAQTVISGEAEVLPTIDPADRKFFSPGYGAQTTSAKRSEAVLPPIENKMGQWGAIWFLLK